MEVSFNSRDILHLSVVPNLKSWSIFIGVMSVGFGAAYYSPDDHAFMKLAYLCGSFILGFILLDDWEDCVFDYCKGQITITRRNCVEWLTSSCSENNTFIIGTNSILAVKVVSVNKMYCTKYRILLVICGGQMIPISSVEYSSKSELEKLAFNIQEVLRLQRVETIKNSWLDDFYFDEYESYDENMQQVESLRGINEKINISEGSESSDSDSNIEVFEE